MSDAAVVRQEGLETAPTSAVPMAGVVPPTCNASRSASSVDGFCECLLDWTNAAGFCEECGLARTTFRGRVNLPPTEEPVQAPTQPPTLQEQLEQLGALGYISASALRAGEALRSAEQEVTRAFTAGDEIQKIQLGAWLNQAVRTYNTLISLHAKAYEPYEARHGAEPGPTRTEKARAAKTLTNEELDALL